MKKKNKNSIRVFGLALLASTALVACRPGQKDPPLAYDHNRVDAKVEELKLDAENPIAKMGIPELWKKSTGKTVEGSRVRVAVIGTGVDYTIPDIRDALWVNVGELSEKTRSNGIDNDGNGYLDDVIGYDFFSGDSLPYDWNGHDTFTASVIAATARANPSLVGVAPNAELMICRYIGPDGRGKGLDAVEALKYAMVNNAKIIYFNWPEGGFDAMETGVVLQTLKAASDKNILVITPAGNSANHSVPTFIQAAAKLSNVVVVAAQDRDGKLKATSNSGRALALTAAPAVGGIGYLRGGIASQAIQTTSVAAAYVTGSAALLATLPQMGSAQKIREALLGATAMNKSGEPLDVLSAGGLSFAAK